MLCHVHEADECRAAYAAWNGFESPLRRAPTLASCANGDHRMYWTVEADGAAQALAQLPPFLATRTEVDEVRMETIP
jgi:hypothetical protein